MAQYQLAHTRGSGLPPMLAKIAGRKDRVPAGSALQTATKLAELLERCELFPQHVGVSRSGSIVLTLQRDTRIASYECDAEGDIVLTLVDNGSEADAVAEVLPLQRIQSSFARARAFVS